MKPRPAVIAAAALAALLLTGCSPDGAPVDPSAQPSTEPSVEPSTPAPVVGATVTKEEALQLQKDSKGQQRGYAMPDGSYIVVDRTQPLPAPVQQDANNKAVAVQAQSPVGTGSGNPIAGIQELPGTLGFQTGKRVLVVSHISAFEYDNTPTEAWFVVGASKSISGMRSVEAATAAAQEYINSQSDPAAWIIVVAN